MGGSSQTSDGGRVLRCGALGSNDRILNIKGCLWEMGKVHRRAGSSWVRTPDLLSPLYLRSSSLAASPAVTHGADNVHYSLLPAPTVC